MGTPENRKILWFKQKKMVACTREVVEEMGISDCNLEIIWRQKS